MAVSEVLEFINSRGQCIARLSIYAFYKEGDTKTLIRLNDATAQAQGEEPMQLIEGARYEYEFEDESHRLGAANGEPGRLIEASYLRQRGHTGFLSPGVNTGRLALVVLNKNGELLGSAAVEVRSRKISYRDDYRHMLEDITDYCVDLLMELRAPTSLRAAADPGHTPQTLAQRFAFLKGLLGSQAFQNALHRVVSHPHQRWEPEQTVLDTRKGFRPDARAIRQLARASRRVQLPMSHPLSTTVKSLPERIALYRNVQTEDTAENRFVKFALQTFSAFLALMRQRLDDAGTADVRLRNELSTLSKQLDTALGADIFRDIPHPDMLPLGSPVLQRKEGYREIYQAWLKFDMAARLVWQGGDDVYHAGQRDIATLYEYWVFFRLLDIVTRVFKLDRPSSKELIEETADGFGLKLKSGEQLGFDGVTFAGNRPLRARFSYNRSFSRQVDPTKEGSWTERMRPDYTLSLWPADFSDKDAEQQELMVHVHFDAKYRVDNIKQLFGRDDNELDRDGKDADLQEEKQQQKRDRYKRADLLKMHAYRDAIRRTQGAYVLYPGTFEQGPWRTFHELLPGLGAFPLKPGQGDDALTNFINDIVIHVCDRATSREQLSYHVNKIYRPKEALQRNTVLHKLPEKYSSGRRRPPIAETFVLIGKYKDDEHLQWILNAGLYDFSIDPDDGSLHMSPEISGAQYLLLLSEDGESSQKLMGISKEGPRVISREALKGFQYPGEPSRPFYLIFDVSSAEGFENYHWDCDELRKRLQSYESRAAQILTLEALMTSGLYV